MYSRQIKTLNSTRGMTLVELVVVMGILSVVMLAVMSLYVPVHQSTVAQTQVSDVNSNLRLAINTMTRDLLTAGFLASRTPIVFPDADLSEPSDMGTANATDFTIRTRVVGSGFARIFSVTTSGSLFQLTVADPAMVSKFPVGAKVRIFGSMNGEELIQTINSGLSSANRVLNVTASSGSMIEVDASVLDVTERGTLAASLVEAVLIHVKDVDQPSLQTIQYKLNGEGGLERIVNGSTQILARNLSSVLFSYSPLPPERIKLVNIKLTGKTQALKNDAISGEKTRELETSVSLRNIF